MAKGEIPEDLRGRAALTNVASPDPLRPCREQISWHVRANPLASRSFVDFTIDQGLALDTLFPSTIRLLVHNALGETAGFLLINRPVSMAPFSGYVISYERSLG
jgi:hypothetical protein